MPSEREAVEAYVMGWLAAELVANVVQVDGVSVLVIRVPYLTPELATFRVRVELVEP